MPEIHQHSVYRPSSYEGTTCVYRARTADRPNDSGEIEQFRKVRKRRRWARQNSRSDAIALVEARAHAALKRGEPVRITLADDTRYWKVFIADELLGRVERVQANTLLLEGAVLIQTERRKGSTLDKLRWLLVDSALLLCEMARFHREITTSICMPAKSDRTQRPESVVVDMHVARRVSNVCRRVECSNAKTLAAFQRPAACGGLAQQRSEQKLLRSQPRVFSPSY